VSINARGAFWKAGWLIASNSMGVRLYAVAAWLTAAAVLLIAAIAARKLGPRILRALWPRKCAVIRIIPPADGAYSREAWVSFFRSLLALTPPVWKQLIVGEPWTTFEYRYAEDRLSVFCSCPEQAIHLVTAALGTALPGADVRLEPHGALMLSSLFVARARLRLWRESLHPIGGAGSGGLESVIAGMTTAPESVLQIAIAHDPAWESKARRRFDRLSGYAPRRNFLVDVFAVALDPTIGQRGGRTALGEGRLT